MTKCIVKSEIYEVETYLFPCYAEVDIYFLLSYDEANTYVWVYTKLILIYLCLSADQLNTYKFMFEYTVSANFLMFEL